MEKHQVRMVLAFGVLSVTSSSFIFLAASKDPYSIAFVRVFLTGLISLFLINKISSRNAVVINNNDLKTIIFSGFSLATHFGWWFASLEYIEVGISLSLTNTAPIWLVIILIIKYNKKPTQYQILSMIFVFAGAFTLFISNSSFGNNVFKGLSLALGSAIGFAIYLLLAKDMVPKYGLWKYFGLVNLSASLFLLLGVIFLGNLSLLFSFSLWYWGLLLALIPGISGHAIYNFSMSKLDPVDVSVATLGEPVLGTIIAYFYLSQKFNELQIIGYSFLLFAILFSVLKSKNEKFENSKKLIV